MNKITAISSFFRVVIWLYIAAIVVIYLLAWARFNESMVFVTSMGSVNFGMIPDYITIAHPLSFMEISQAMLATAVPVVVKVLIAFNLHKLFTYFAKKQIFCIENVKTIRNVAILLLVFEVASILIDTLLGVILTIHNPPHMRMAQISFGAPNLGVIFCALIIFLVAWILREGYKLRAENELTI